jgi:hypothetical protein
MPAPLRKSGWTKKGFIIMETKKRATAWPEQLPPIKACDTSTLITWLPHVDQDCATYQEVLGVLSDRYDLYDLCDKYLKAALGDFDAAVTIGIQKEVP